MGESDVTWILKKITGQNLGPNLRCLAAGGEDHMVTVRDPEAVGWCTWHGAWMLWKCVELWRINDLMTHKKSNNSGGKLHLLMFATCSPLLGQDFQSTDRFQLDGSTSYSNNSRPSPRQRKKPNRSVIKLEVRKNAAVCDQHGHTPQQDPTTSKKIVPHRILTTAWEGRDDMKQINENLWPICIHLLCMKNRRTEEIHYTTWYHHVLALFAFVEVWDMASKHVLFQMDPVKVGPFFLGRFWRWRSTFWCWKWWKVGLWTLNMMSFPTSLHFGVWTRCFVNGRQAPVGSHANWWLRTSGQFPGHQSCVTWTCAPAFLCFVASKVFVHLEKRGWWRLVFSQHC